MIESFSLCALHAGVDHFNWTMYSSVLLAGSEVTPNLTYYIRLAGYYGAHGTYKLVWDRITGMTVLLLLALLSQVGSTHASSHTVATSIRPRAKYHVRVSTWPYAFLCSTRV